MVRAVRGETDIFEIIAGERRWRAAQRAGLHEVPVAVVEATDAQALEFAIIENVQRADLNAIEEAAGYLALMEEFNHSQDEVAQIVGKSRPHVANMVRLLKLPEPVKALVQAGQIVGRPRAPAGRPAERASARRVTIVRGLQRAPARGSGCARRRASQATRPRRNADEDPRRAPRTPTPRALERRLSDALGLGRDASIIAARAARCISSTAIWISWMGC